MSFRLTALMLCAASLIATSCSTTSVDKNSLTAEKGATLTIRLEGNPSTGYGWEASEISPNLTLIEKRFEDTRTDPQLVGAPGIFVFTFKALEVGMGSVRLDYLRPWEKTAPIKSETYRIRVR